MNYSYNYSGTCAADGDCDGNNVVCKGDSTCGACAADTDCDGDPICKTDNTCGKYIYVIFYEISSTKKYRTQLQVHNELFL